MMPFETRRRPVWLPVMLSIAAVALLSTSAGARKAPPVKTIYTFCKEQSCLDGSHPSGDLLMDVDQNLYGTTTGGGQNGKGTVFEVIQNAVTGSHRHKVIYDFCNAAGCTDGGQPIDGTLIQDVDGSLYGTTSTGGPTGGESGGGVVFKLTPNAQKSRWTYSIVYNFCQEATCKDGLTPVGNLTYAGASTGAPYDKVSPLYGTAMSGGKHNNGIAFALTPKIDGGWRELPLYFFCAHGGSCSDGKAPVGGLVLTSDGVLAGTTALGGVSDGGVAFKLTQVGALHWNEAVVHQFCSSENCADGKSPLSGLSIDANDNVYGTTVAGGNTNAICPSTGCGVAFKIDTHNLLTQIYAFCSQDNCFDGGVPSRLSLDSSGNPTGLTTVGGKNGAGTLYQLNGGFASLYDFICNETVCTTGTVPQGGVVDDGTGDLFTTMSSGGGDNGGTVIEYIPPAQ